MLLTEATRCSNRVELTAPRDSGQWYQALHPQSLGILAESLPCHSMLRQAIPAQIMANQATLDGSTPALVFSQEALPVFTRAQEMRNPGTPPDALQYLAQVNRAMPIPPAASISDKGDRTIHQDRTLALDRVIPAVKLPVEQSNI